MIRPSPRASALCTLVLASALAGTCAGEPAGRNAPAPTPGEDQAADAPTPGEETVTTAEAEADRALTLGEPVTLRLALPEELRETVREYVAGADAPTLRLSLQGLENPAAAVGVRVFVQHPAADAETPLEDPRYAGEVGFFPTGTYGGGDEDLGESTFLLDLGRTLAKLPADERLTDEGVLVVTLIAVPLRDEGAETVVEIPFDGVRLSVHEGEE